MRTQISDHSRGRVGGFIVLFYLLPSAVTHMREHLLAYLCYIHAAFGVRDQRAQVFEPADALCIQTISIYITVSKKLLEVLNVEGISIIGGDASADCMNLVNSQPVYQLCTHPVNSNRQHDPFNYWRGGAFILCILGHKKTHEPPEKIPDNQKPRNNAEGNLCLFNMK